MTQTNMLNEIRLKNFTVFSEANFQFSEGLNLIVGENGAGKTHVLKLAYSIIHSLATNRHKNAVPVAASHFLGSMIAEKLMGVFRPDELGRLVRRQRGRNRCDVHFSLPEFKSVSFHFSTASKREVELNYRPAQWLEKLPAFLPTRELLSIYPGFVSLYETTHLPFEETYRDTCLLLGAPLAKGPREASINELLKPLEEAMGGKIEFDEGGRFYLKNESGRMEIHLVAEGLRKLGMLARLIATGQLVEHGYLFWDEPEANLNPKVVKTVARTIVSLCKGGIQTFVATHSLFLMREIDILLQTDEFEKTPRRFFGLHPKKGGVAVKQGESIDDIGQIASLQEELTQSDRYLEAGND